MNPRLNVHFGVITRKVTSVLTFVLAVSVRNTKCHGALTNGEDGVKSTEKKNFLEGPQGCYFWRHAKVRSTGKDLVYK